MHLDEHRLTQMNFDELDQNRLNQIKLILYSNLDEFRLT